MNRCRGCYQNTAHHTGCTVHRVVLGGGTFERRRYDALAAVRCGGCNTIQGGYHHLGCEHERCPSCGGISSACRCSRAAPLALKGPPVFADGSIPDAPYELNFGRE